MFKKRKLREKKKDYQFPLPEGRGLEKPKLIRRH